MINQPPDKLGRFVGCDSTGNTKDYFFDNKLIALLYQSDSHAEQQTVVTKTTSNPRALPSKKTRRNRQHHARKNLTLPPWQ